MTEHGEEEKRESSKTRRKQLGGIKAMPFILANEACDRFAHTGFHANLITYLTKELNLPPVKASNIVTNFDGTCNLTPLLGGLIADSFAGRFWTILGGSIFYELGMLSVTLATLLPQLHPPPCLKQQNCKEASSQQLVYLYLSLLLTSLGTGGIRPCVVTFVADQFDMTKAKVAARSWNIFNCYYFCMAVAKLAALTVVVYIQDNVGWSWGFGIPAIATFLSIVVFVIGYPLYKHVKPEGSPLTRLGQVIVAAMKKRNVVPPAEPGLLYENKELDAAISLDGRLVHTNQFRWFDRAAIVTDADIDASGKPNLWGLATVHRVEELKSIIRVLPIWVAGILLVTCQSHINSFTILQARTMDRRLSHSFQMPPASLASFTVITVLISLPLYERAFVPLVRRFTGNPSGITNLQRMGIGLGINILSTAASALVEIKRKSVASHHNLLDRPTVVIPVSVFWLIPQFCLHGISEALVSVGHLEFLYDQSPESMRSTAVALYAAAIALGDYMGSLLVSLVHKYTGHERNWLPDRNLNRGRLENYYWLVTGIQLVNLMYYAICAWYYRYKPLEELTESSDEIDMGLAKDKRLADHSKVDGETELARIN